MHHQRLTFLFALLMLLIGCDEKKSEPKGTAQPTEIGSSFDSSEAASIEIDINWNGPLPKPDPIESRPSPMWPPRGGGGPKQQWPNPHSPKVDSETNGICDALVYLRKVDLSESRPWDHPPVTVEGKHLNVRVRQGDVLSRVGIVRKGQPIEMVSKDSWLYAMRARGAAFFTQMIPDPHKPVKRFFSTAGTVSLQSGTGRYWMRNYLFVTEHPYVARTNAQGKAILPQVPPGDYEIVCWLPNWHIKSTERHWGTTQIIRATFHKPLERSHAISVTSGETATWKLNLSAKDWEGHSAP